MKFYSILISCFVLSFKLIAQERHFPFFSDISKSRYIFSDTALVKVAPSNQAAEKDTLFAGDSVQIQLLTDYHEFINGFAALWLKVDYFKNGFQRTGFVWGGVMAIATLKDQNELLLLGLKKTTIKDYFVAKQLQVQYKNEFGLKTISNAVKKEVSFLQNDLELSASVNFIALKNQFSLLPVYEIQFKGASNTKQAKKYYIARCFGQLINLFTSSSNKQVFKLLSGDDAGIKFSLQDGKILKQKTLKYKDCKLAG